MIIVGEKISMRNSFFQILKMISKFVLFEYVYNKVKLLVHNFEHTYKKIALCNPNMTAN